MAILWIINFVWAGLLVAFVVAVMNNKEPDQILASEGQSRLSGYLNATALGHDAVVSGSIFDMEARERRERIQARWDEYRMQRATAQAIGPARRQGRL